MIMDITLKLKNLLDFYSDNEEKLLISTNTDPRMKDFDLGGGDEKMNMLEIDKNEPNLIG